MRTSAQARSYRAGGLVAAAFVLGCGGGGEVAFVGQRDGGGAGGLGNADANDDAAAPAPTGDFFKGDAPQAPPLVMGPAPDDSCAAQSVAAERVPLDLYIIMDSSGSMRDGTTAGATKWVAVKAAIASFVSDPSSAGLGVGLQFFPIIDRNVPEECQSDGACGAGGPCLRLRICYAPGITMVSACDQTSDCPSGQECVLLGTCTFSNNNNYEYCAALPNAACQGRKGNLCQAISGYCQGRDSCEAGAYAQPAVPMDPLPGAAAAIRAALDRQQPEGLTPTGPALAGALAYARRLARSDTNRRVAVLLATDGFPVTCTPTDVPSIANTARGAAGESPPLLTFVVGVFAADEQDEATRNLTALAEAGGTQRPYIINTGQDVTRAFLQALNDIRTTALACEYQVPAATMGEIDFGKVNFRFTSGDGRVTTVGYVRTAAGCHPTLGGWYYDADPAAGGSPRRIATCPNTCEALRADPRGRVDIALGCKTLVIE